MSEEEREELRNFKSEYETCNYNSSDLIIELDDAKIILNLIEKQQKEIEELKELDLIKIKGKEYVSKDKIKAKIEEINKEMLNEENSTEGMILERYVSKDRIREEIEEIEKMKENIEEIDVSRIKFAELILQSLLEE